MPSKEILSRYSCKRKRDFITASAVLMLLFIVLAQLYLTLIVPIQLEKRNIYEFHVEKDRVIKQVDIFRSRMARLRPADKTARGEVDLVRNVMNQFVIYVTEHQDQMSWKQISDLKKIFNNFDGYWVRWTKKKPEYHIRKEMIDQKKLVNAIVDKLVAEKKN